jgi:hypothetical protein
LSGEDRLREHVGGLLDERKLVADAVEEALAGVEVLEGGRHRNDEFRMRNDE